MASIKVLQAFISDNDLNMTVFFQTFFMDEYPTGRSAQPVYFDALGARADIAKQEVHYWLIRNSKLSDEATALLRRYFCLHNNSPPGAISSSHILAWNWLPEAVGERFKVALDGPLQSGEDVREVDGLEEIDRGWDENEKSDFERCRKYGRLSRQLDVWWAAARGPFYESSQPADIPTVAAAKATLMSLKESLMSRTGRAGLEGKESDTPNDTPSDPAQLKPAPFTYIESWPYRTDLNDSSAFADGPIVGLLAEIPNIIDPDHIPVFHAIILQSVVDQPGVSVSAVGENLSKARCRLLLATEAGRSLFRELLVYIGLWHKYEESTIFRVTREVVEAIHRNGLIPYAWVSLKSKDVISPAQAILLRIIGRIFQLRHAEPDSLTEKQRLEDMRLLSFFFREFRLRIVPECAALMNLQGCMRQGMYDHSEFPLDNWCMARINDGLIQYIQFLTVMADIYDIRQSLIQWEIAYDVIVLIKFAESAVLRKPFIPPAAADGSTASGSGQPHLSAAGAPSSPPPPPPPPHQGSVASSSTTTATTAAAYKGPTVQRKHAVERPYSPDAGSSGNGDADGDGDGDGSDDNEDGDGSDDALEEFDHPPHEYPWTGLKREVLALVATLLQPEPGQTRPGNPTVQRQFIENEGIVALLSYTIYDEHDPKGCGKRAIRWLLDGSVDINKFIRAIAARHQHEMHAQQEKSHNEQPEKQPQQEQQLPEREEDDHDDEEGREQPEGDSKPPPAGHSTSEKGKGEAKLPHTAPASSAAGAGSSSANAADDAATISVTSKSVKAKKAAGNRRRRG